MIRILLALLLVLLSSPASATVNEVFARNDYSGNASTTSFPYTFKIISQADIIVLLNGAQQMLNVAYTVIGVDNPAGGAVIFAVPPVTGARVTLLRGQKFQQLSIYTPNEAFPAKRIETDFDKNTMEDQRHVEEIGRALKFDPHSLYRNVFVDDPIAGKCLAWNASRTRVVSANCSGSDVGVGPVTGSGEAGQVTFWTGTTTIAGDGKFLWNNLTKEMTVGTTPLGPLKPGNAFMGLQGPSNATGMQNLMLQTVQGDPSLIGLVTLGDDRVGLSSWNFRGTGATNPIYGANFGVVFNTNGVANGLEIDVQNDSATNFQGQALWLNGSTRAAGPPGTVGHRANAILIDTQDGSKWERGILFKEGFVANGATGSIEKMGIHFEHSQDADFIVIQPRLGTLGNVAVKLTNPEFTLNRFELLNSGAIRVGNTLTGPAFPSYAFVEDGTTGMYMEANSVLGFAVRTSIPCPIGATPPCFAGTRRMTLDNALNMWPGAGQGGGINFFDPTSVHSVGLMAPDFVGNSFRIKLPAVPGIAGQCVVTNAGFPVSQWSYGSCGGGGVGGGGNVTSGVLAVNQIVLGDGGSAIKTLGTLGTGNLVLHGNPLGVPVFGPVVVADISATGTPSSTTFLRGDGAWAAVPGSGTVTTTGAPAAPMIPVFTAPTVIGGVPEFVWDNSLKRLVVGLVNNVTSVSRATVVSGRSTGNGDPTTEINSTFAGASPTLNHPVALSLTGDFAGGGVQPVGFGVMLEFATRDYAGAGTAISNAFITTKTQTLTPMTAELIFGTSVAGTATPLLSLSGGQALSLRQVRSQVLNSVNPLGGTFVASKDFSAGAFSTNDSIGALIFSGENMSPVIDGGAAAIQSNVDATGGSRIKGRLSFQTSDGTNLVERMRIGSDGATLVGSTALTDPGHVFGVTGSGSAIVRVESLGSATLPRTALQLVRATTGQMSGAFAVEQHFILRDDDGVDNVSTIIAAGVGTTRDDSGSFSIKTSFQGIMQDRFSVNDSGQIFVYPNPTIPTGLFGLLANGTVRTELGFFTNSNANFVKLQAPPTATGNHLWMLPSTLGTAGQVLATSGASGQLVWADPAASGGGGSISGTGVAGQFALWSGTSVLTSNSGLSLDGTGQVLYTPTPTVGTLGLLSNGTRRTQLLFATNSNAQFVGFTAPATATSSPLLWTLPTTLGAATSVLTNDGAGNLSWAIPATGGGGTVTGSGVASRLAFWSSASALTSDIDMTFDGTTFTLGGTGGGGNLIARQLVPTFTGGIPNIVVKEAGGGGPFLPSGDGTFTYRPYMRILMNNVANAQKTGIQIESVSSGYGPNGAGANEGLFVGHFSDKDNLHDASGITGVEWGNGNAASFMKFVESRPAGLPALADPISRQWGYALEVAAEGDSTSLGVTTRGTGIGIGISVSPVVGPPWTEGIRIIPAHRSGSDPTNPPDIDKRVALLVASHADNLDQTAFYRFKMWLDGTTHIGMPIGTQAAGPLKVSLSNSNNANPFQTIMAQVVNGSEASVTQSTIANDKVAISGSAFRGAGGTSPIYAGFFGVDFATTGVANGIEVGMVNHSGTHGIGNGLWLNGDGSHNRDNALLIDTQNGSKWDAGIRFTEGNTANGATGSHNNYGIIFDKSSDIDFIVIRPRVGAGNAAFRITDPTFSSNKFTIYNTGSIDMNGGINAVGNIGANQFFAASLPGFSGTKVAGSCTFTITGGIITNVTGC